MSTKQDIIDYVMHTPANTNRAVLEALLDDLKCVAIVGEATVTDETEESNGPLNGGTIESSPDAGPKV